MFSTEDTWFFYQAHLPILNVKYDPGGCGGSHLSYRDAVNHMAAFQVEPEAVVQPGYAELCEGFRFETVCDHPGFDIDVGFRGIDFKGVVVDKKAERLILTTEMEVGWYRYIQQWTFLLDGTIEPQIGFTARIDACTEKAHNHHAYWRFDFDINDASSDLIEEATQVANSPRSLEALGESARKRLIFPVRRWWQVRDKTTGRGYEVFPGRRDDWADNWAVADVWAFHYQDRERDDGGATRGSHGDAAHINQYINGEDIDGQDVVMWYRTGARHAAGLKCDMVGPTLKPFGAWLRLPRPPPPPH